MEIGLGNLPALPGSLTQLSWANLLMMAVGGLLIYLAIAKEYEPGLLIPIGDGRERGGAGGVGRGGRHLARTGGEVGGERAACRVLREASNVKRDLPFVGSLFADSPFADLLIC